MPSEYERENTQPHASSPAATPGRHVLLSTSSFSKVQEYKSLLSKYAVDVLQAPPALASDGAARTAALAAPGCLAVLHDQATLLSKEGLPADLSLAALADARVTLEAWLKDQEGGVEGAPAFSHTDVTVGFLDPSLAVPALHKLAKISSVFGYDDIFVPLTTGVSYHAASEKGGKVSSRITVASELVRKLLHFKKRIDLKHAPLLAHATIDFSVDVTTFVEGHPLLSRGLAVPGYGSVLRSVLNGGIFLKAPGNKRERNYWLPGLNAGLPLTPKDDAVHEATYAAHDFGHIAVPDLIWSGSALCKSRLGIRVYLVHRMLSEAVTMVLADMLYADGLRRQGVDYDYTRRRIWPLLAATEAHTGRSLLGSGQLNLELLHDLLSANAAFALCGNAAPYEALVGPAGLEALGRYKAKVSHWLTRAAAACAQCLTHLPPLPIPFPSFPPPYLSLSSLHVARFSVCSMRPSLWQTMPGQQPMWATWQSAPPPLQPGGARQSS
jgi:adenylate kinase